MAWQDFFNRNEPTYFDNPFIGGIAHVSPTKNENEIIVDQVDIHCCDIHLHSDTYHIFPYLLVYRCG